MGGVTLANKLSAVDVRPEEGGRIASLLDRRSGRELLYQTHPLTTDRTEYMSCYAGGWEEMFPNDSRWRRYPFHGVLWNAGFRVTDRGEQHVALETDLDRPHVSCHYRFRLLDPPRCGLRLKIDLRAQSDTGPFLWTSHPALAVDPGWRITINSSPLEADTAWPGRFAPGPLTAEDRQRALTVPEAGRRLAEVLYGHRVSCAHVSSPDGPARTRIAWDSTFLEHVWLTTVVDEGPIHLALLIEPSTSRPFDLEEAIARRQARRLDAGETATWWIELESLDRA